MRRLRPLLIAEAANPEWVSVPLVGWSHARAIMDVSDAHLVTQVRNRAAIERAGLVEGKDFTAIDSEAVARRAQAVSRRLRGKSGVSWTTSTALQSLAYPYFEHLVWEKFAHSLRLGEFDLVHRITPLSPTAPSMIAGKLASIHPRVPFVLGPLNGGVPWPRGFDQARRREKEWLSYVRDFYKFLPGYRGTRQHAAAILIGSRDTWEQMPRRYHEKCFYVPENAIDPSRFQKRRCRAARLPIKGVFVGRLVPYKGADMLLEAALPLLKDGRMTLDVVGDGPQMHKLREVIARENVSSAVTLHGWVKHEQVQDRLVEADLLTFPSIREFGGGVALEAMAAGVVPVVTNYGGLAELVSPATGFLIEMGTRSEIIGRLRDTLSRLAETPALIDAKSDAAYARAHRQFTWSAKAEQTLAIYDWVLGRGARLRPQFPMPTPDLM
ncbi:MAG: glycogen synthase [Phycisphaerales bacterium]|nr:glycogen synthase [Phycisphaerales bacterium]